MRSFAIMILMMISSFSLQAADTTLKLFRPFILTDRVIKARLQGVCQQQSLRIKREDALRCTAGGKLFDPCFIRPYGSKTEAQCLDSPWDTAVVQIDLSSPADNAAYETLDMSRTWPWALELAHGEKCLAQEEGEVFDDLTVRYQCAGQGILFGYLQRCRTPWTILKRSANGSVKTVVIEKAWF